jgi:N-dimethylarginine dimethylaminohydrolase
MLCSPERFEVTYRINPWMEPVAWAGEAAKLGAAARRGWCCLRDMYRALSARIETLAPQRGLPDLVFTANSAVVLDGRVVLARFLNPQRRGEEPHNRRFFENLMLRGFVDSLHEMPPGVFFEGAGDAIWDAHRKTLWLGYGQRSSLDARDTLRQVLGVDTVSLELASPRFYHLDTCLCLLAGGEILWYPPAFTPASQALLRTLAGDALIEAGDDDANHLGVNAVSLGRDLVTGWCSPALGERLEALGYRVRRVPLEPFILSGGGAWWLTLRLDNRSGKQGVAANRLAA